MGFGVPPHANATMSFELACTGVATSCKFKILARWLRVDVTSSLLDIICMREVKILATARRAQNHDVRGMLLRGVKY